MGTWGAEGTLNNPGAFLNFQPDYNLVDYDAGGNFLWQSGTYGTGADLPGQCFVSPNQGLWQCSFANSFLAKANTRSLVATRAFDLPRIHFNDLRATLDLARQVRVGSGRSRR